MTDTLKSSNDKIIMPQLGESITEGTLTAWLKKVGDYVEQDEPLFEISTDKVSAEIPAASAGILQEIKVQPGETVPVNTIVAIIAPSATATTLASEPLISAKAPKLRSSPVVRKMAQIHQVDLRNLVGTGFEGRITKQDFLAYLEKPATPTTSTPIMPTTTPPNYRPQIFAGDRTEQISLMRAKISEHVTLSKQISAHVTSIFDADFSRLRSLREQYKATFKAQNLNLTYTPLIAKATILALQETPLLNTSLEAETLIWHKHINLSIAVALPWGLITPVVFQAETLSFKELTHAINDLTLKARNKKLAPEDVCCGTFTITNHGTAGSLCGTPLINQPQVAILGIGKIEKRVTVLQDNLLAIQDRAYLSLSFDHRLIDGAVADDFMSKLKNHLENFNEDYLKKN